MAYLIKLPAVAADASGGALQQWLKQEGEAIALGEAIAEIETDKALVEINAEHAGTLGRIVVPAGTAGVAVNTVLGVILAPGESADAIAAALAGQDAPQTTAQPTPASTPDIDNAPGQPAPPDRVFASPLARRLAREWQVDLAGLRGSGPRGRVLRRDVDAARSASSALLAAPHASSPAVSTLPANLPAQHTPHSSMRRAIARRLSESKQHIPHFYLTVDCRMDSLLALRAQANQAIDTRLSVNDFIVRAAALALREVPDVNVSWQDEHMVRHASADISVAVATDGGLVTPIVRHADHKTLSDISREIAELAERARLNRLRPEEFTGGSLTVSNLGMYGIREFSAIINPPQAAILAVGAAEKRPVADDDGNLAVATLMTVTLSADHRAVDGAVGARWLAAFRQLIENPVRIFL